MKLIKKKKNLIFLKINIIKIINIAKINKKNKIF